ncbi:MAG: hypothetical protein ABEL76_14600 [Bradymonadaceae bacterium]
MGDVTIDSEENIVASGRTLGGRGHSGDEGAFLVKLDPSGSETWMRYVNEGAKEDEIFALAAGESGSLYAAGSSNVGLGDEVIPGDDATFIAKYDSEGERVWSDMTGTRSFDSARAVAVDGDGNVYFAGFVGEQLGKQQFGGGNYDAFVAKYTSDGDHQWTNSFGGSGADQAHGLAVVDGAAFVVGEATDAIGDGEYNGGESDGFIARYNTDGTQQWVRMVGTSAADKLFSAASTPDGSLAVGGSTGGELGGRSFNGGDLDGFVAEYSTDGESQWTRLVGASGTDKIDAVHVAADGSFHAAGTTDQKLGDSSFNGGDSDAFLASFGGDGSLQGIDLVGNSGADKARGLANGPNGELYLGGETDGAFEGSDQKLGRSSGFVARVK